MLAAGSGGLAGCSTETTTHRDGVRVARAVPGAADGSGAPTAGRIVRDGVRAALKASTASYTYSARSSEQGARSTAAGAGRVDLAAGRLDHELDVRSGAESWRSRNLIVGGRAYVKALTGPTAGRWYRAPADSGRTTYTRDGWADPLEYLRLLLTLGGDVTVVGDRVVTGLDVVAYAGDARPTRKVPAGYLRPGRAPGELAGDLRYLGVTAPAVRVYLDGKGLPIRITVAGTGRRDGARTSIAATLTFAGWGAPQNITAPAGDVPTFTELYGT